MPDGLTDYIKQRLRRNQAESAAERFWDDVDPGDRYLPRGDRVNRPTRLSHFENERRKVIQDLAERRAQRTANDAFRDLDPETQRLFGPGDAFDPRTRDALDKLKRPDPGPTRMFEGLDATGPFSAGRRNPMAPNSSAQSTRFERFERTQPESIRDLAESLGRKTVNDAFRDLDPETQRLFGPGDAFDPRTRDALDQLKRPDHGPTSMFEGIDATGPSGISGGHSWLDRGPGSPGRPDLPWTSDRSAFGGSDNLLQNLGNRLASTPPNPVQNDRLTAPATGFGSAGWAQQQNRGNPFL